MRFIIDKSRPADFNMAADAYLLERCGDGGGVTVRFYSWARPSITLGCMQNAETELDLGNNAEIIMQNAEIKQNNIDNTVVGATAPGRPPLTLKNAERGVDWIKRPTGGRAILHDGDITYSCVFPKSVKEMGGGITQTYRLISKCLMNGLERASIKCEAHDSDSDLRGIKRGVKLPCFLAPNRDEIMVGGRKLVGSAQKRTANAVLQHGSIPITGAFRRLPEYLRIDEEEREKQIQLLMSKSCCVDELVTGATFESLAKCLMEGFLSVLPFEGEIVPWSSDEIADINKISAAL